MLDVNIWLPTTVLFNKYRIKHGIFGPILASESKGEHVGHANFIVKIDERSKDYVFVDANFEELGPKKTLDIIPTSVATEKHQSSIAPKTVRCNQFTNSFWPDKKPTVSSILFKDPLKKLHLYPGKAGVKASFEAHEDDMRAEEDRVHSIISIEHKQPLAAFIEQIQSEKRTNLDFIVSTNELELNLDKSEELQRQLGQLEKGHVELTNQWHQLTQSHQAQMRELKLSQERNTQHMEGNRTQLKSQERIQTYLLQIQNPEQSAQKQLTAITQNIQKLKTERQRLIKENEALSALKQSLESHYAQDVGQLETTLAQNKNQKEEITTAIKEVELKIDGKTRKDVAALIMDGRRRTETTKRKEQFLKDRDFTEGKQPEYTITLPTKMDGVPYYLDEIKVLEAMRKERQTKYSFIFHNCAASVKSCLLAGISEPLKKKLREAGVKSSFFTMDTIETCKSLKTWACTLQTALLKLNTQATQENELSENEPDGKVIALGA
ncbi:hypothetical protein [Legionella fallonii]|uniref:Uncharacterized protein n=1 Tax=Legionella fallonii LLAP-10 TaxID=1212491 RepID=A0A098G9V7_9GAMM|nr:hypothetical protein [Legionella fallonii]CEG58790.1 conserved protein of unknown function [Legionella fallonii LLAP-10]